MPGLQEFLQQRRLGRQADQRESATGFRNTDTNSFLNFFGNQGGSDDLLRQFGFFNERRDQGTRPISQIFNQPGVNTAGALAAGAGPLTTIGMSDLAMRLLGQGATDPTRLNRQLTDISRSGEGTKQAFDETVARTGSNSGLAQALSAAIDQSTGAERSRAIGQENALAEARRRQDLQLLAQLVFGPATDFSAIGTGQFNASANRDQQDRAGTLNFIGSLLGGGLGLFGGGSGGGA